MEEGKLCGNHLVSPAAFVEGGIQEACDDACSICLEVFCDNEPSTLTVCKHEYHLQCILEWCQRSSQCPMCWQPISLKDPISQELLDGVEQERNIRMNPAPRNNTTIFHHPTLGDFELRRLPLDINDSEMEERIIQHLAAAAAMGRARHLARGEGQRSSGRSSSTQGHPRYLVFSNHPDGPSTDSPGRPSRPWITIAEDSVDLIARPNSPQADQLTPTRTSTGADGTSSYNRSPTQASPSSQDRAGPSDLQAFSESVKSRLSALSMRCKDSITKNTRGWKDRLFSRNSSSPNHPAEVHEAVNRCPGIEIPEAVATSSNAAEDNSTRDPIEEHITNTSAGPSIMNHKPEASSSTST